MAKLLLANGASPTLQSSVGIPLEMVMQTGYPEWIEEFRNAQTLVIPVYTVTEILALLPPRDLYRCRRVCKDFRILADEIIARPSYWSNLKLSKEFYVNSAAMLRQCSVGIQDFVQPDPPAVPVGSTPEYDYLFKYVVVGDIRAGKKELMQCFVRHSFQNSENPEFVVKTVKCNERTIKLQVWNYSPDRFRVNNRNPYRGAGLVMIGFDLTNRETFDNVKNWFADLQRYASEVSF
ncbi:hypothetical protein Pelo_15592 [Pelomyxa schiedti]|nr:hypothetical protein Pelo_15592 [Pelomyxa schiedti]